MNGKIEQSDSAQQPLRPRPLWQRLLYPFIGIILVILGIILWLTPVVMGFPLIIIGVPLLFCFHPRLELRFRRKMHTIRLMMMNKVKRTEEKRAEVAAMENSSSDSIEYAKSIGYSKQEMKSVPEEAALTHGCGNPTVLAELKEGQTVLDLGCGGGLDVFLAARKVGRKGRVIGLDSSPEIVEKADTSARKNKYENVEFKVAEIEKLPVPDDFVDVVISNCVINHSSDKLVVFREAHRVLKPGGRMFVSDLVTAGKFTEHDLQSVDKLWADWLAAASGKQDYLNAIKEAGFRIITVLAEGTFPMAEADNILKGKIISIQIKGIK
ncbi:MAG: methyltransferase domain-containing protein [Planctomycetes bacterium]|nr:methyltransferase domain-containing protein [Planctomycetota bacterium]